MADHDVRREPDVRKESSATGATSAGTREHRVEPAAGETYPGAISYRDTLDTSVTAPVGRQRINWGPVWAGFVIALAVYLLLEMLIFATGAREIDIDAGVNEGALVTGIAALVAFFIGGLVAGATMRWTAPADGFLHGLLVWGLGIVAFLVLSVLGAGLALGGIGTAAGELGVDIEQLAEDAGEEFDAAQVADDARDAAGIALLVLGLTLLAAGAGGVVGSRIGAEDRAGAIDLREGQPADDRVR
jgi:hypothetical protein